MYRKYLKRILDFILSFLGLVILSPAILVILIALGISFRINPLFIQKRTGKNGKVFSLLKFRTMNEAKDSSGELLPDMQRITKLGSFFRKTSLDEIPNLWNVLCGDMSLVGPRPLLPEYLPYYNKEQNRRHEVFPGITGWAQVNGRNTISWEEKFNLDIWYVNHLSFALDWKIIFRTLKKIFRFKDVNASDEDTMERLDRIKN